MKILGIDYGTKRIGIAISNEDENMAFPRGVIENNSDLVKKIQKTIDSEEIKKVVIGDSKNYKMLDNEIMQEVLDFKQILEKEIGVSVEMHSELLSSSQAEQIQGKNDHIDASAAAIILQSYLDLQIYNKKDK